jgi:hypothetical protein
MKKGTTAHEKEIIEIADMIFANPSLTMSEIRENYAQIYAKSAHTIRRWVTKAKAYNNARLKEQEAIKSQMLAEATKEQVKKDIADREELLIGFTEIFRGKERKVPTKFTRLTDGTMVASEVEIKYPTPAERVKAGEKIAIMQGWNAPAKTELTGKDGDDLFKGKTREEVEAELIRVVSILTDE